MLLELRIVNHIYIFILTLASGKISPRTNADPPVPVPTSRITFGASIWVSSKYSLRNQVFRIVSFKKENFEFPKYEILTVCPLRYPLGRKCTYVKS